MVRIYNTTCIFIFILSVIPLSLSVGANSEELVCKPQEGLHLTAPFPKPAFLSSPLALCPEYSCSCCNRTSVVPLHRPLLLLRDDATFSRGCLAALWSLACRPCDPEVGVGLKPSLCGGWCRSLFAACSRDFFLFDERSGRLLPCAEGAGGGGGGGGPLVCARLDALVTDGAALCHGLTGAAVTGSSSRNDNAAYAYGDEDDEEESRCFDGSAPRRTDFCVAAPPQPASSAADGKGKKGGFFSSFFWRRKAAEGGSGSAGEEAGGDESGGGGDGEDDLEGQSGEGDGEARSPHQPNQQREPSSTTGPSRKASASSNSKTSKGSGNRKPQGSWSMSKGQGESQTRGAAGGKRRRLEGAEQDGGEEDKLQHLRRQVIFVLACLTIASSLLVGYRLAMQYLWSGNGARRRPTVNFQGRAKGAASSSPRPHSSSYCYSLAQRLYRRVSSVLAFTFQDRGLGFTVAASPPAARGEAAAGDGSGRRVKAPRDKGGARGGEGNGGGGSGEGLCGRSRLLR